MVDNIDVKGVLRRIEMRMAELEIPKEKFYAESGVSSASYSQWNTGTHKPTIKKLKSVANYLGVSLNYLLTGKDQKGSSPQGGELTEDELRLLTAYRAAPEKKRANILGLLEN